MPTPKLQYPCHACARAMHHSTANIPARFMTKYSNQIKYKAAPIAAAPQMGACGKTAAPAVEVRVAELAAFDAALLMLLSAAAALLLMLEISLCKLLFAAPVAVAATLEILAIAIEASLSAAEIAELAALIPVEIAPPA
jgi:hypothetical protein